MVTISTIHKPSKVDRARERLADAVARLESALSSASSTSSSGQDGADSAKISQLMGDLQNLQAENGRLRDQKKQVSERLGATINRFKQAIGD